MSTADTTLMARRGLISTAVGRFPRVTFVCCSCFPKQATDVKVSYFYLFKLLSRNFAKNTILDEFAGPPQTGVYSPSVQVSFCCQKKQQINNKVAENSTEILAQGTTTEGMCC